jgi:hypothetical protein
MHNSIQNKPGSRPLRASLSSNSTHPEPANAGQDETCGIERCPICGNFLRGVYYRIDGKVGCALCAIQARARNTGPDRTAFNRLRSILAAKPRNLDQLDGPYKA